MSVAAVAPFVIVSRTEEEPEPEVIIISDDDDTDDEIDGSSSTHYNPRSPIRPAYVEEISESDLGDYEDLEAIRGETEWTPPTPSSVTIDLTEEEEDEEVCSF